MTEQLEIERRFLLKQVPHTFAHMRGLEIAQYYVESSDERFRVRETYEHPGKMSYDKTYKETISKGVNKERILAIDNDMFQSLARKGTRLINKQRIIAPHTEGLKWEIDLLLPPKKLVIAEIEVPSMEYPLILPDFIQEVLVMEITGINEFSNYALADTIQPW